MQALADHSRAQNVFSHWRIFKHRGVSSPASCFQMISQLLRGEWFVEGARAGRGEADQEGPVEIQKGDDLSWNMRVVVGMGRKGQIQDTFWRGADRTCQWMTCGSWRERETTWVKVLVTEMEKDWGQMMGFGQEKSSPILDRLHLRNLLDIQVRNSNGSFQGQRQKFAIDQHIHGI